VRNRSVILFLFFSLTLFLARCRLDQPLISDAFLPAVSELSLPDTVYLQSTDSNVVSVQAADPQGLADIHLVRLLIQPLDGREILYSDTLKDDGSGADIIPDDGVFTTLVSGELIDSLAGTYGYWIFAVDNSGNHSDTLSGSFEAVDALANQRPRLFDSVSPDSILFADLDQFRATVVVSDGNGQADIDSVWLDFYPAGSGNSIYRALMNDAGINGDEKAADSVFTYGGELAGKVTSGGAYKLRFQAVDQAGARSLPLVRDLTIITVEGPPTLSDLSAPDTVSRSTTGPFLLAVRGDDPSGLSDITKVYFQVTQPDGSSSQGNPFPMYDDGSHGDLQALDGIWSIMVSISTQNNLGRYRFDYLAEDRSGAVSDTLTHYITVVE